jgi:outer membrane biosynthesis protein TonB
MCRPLRLQLQEIEACQKMKQIDINQPKIIAAVATFVIALLLLLLLFVCNVGYDREALAASSIPQPEEDEEVFLEPELMNLGEETSVENTEAAPLPQGEPEEAQEENKIRIENGNNEKPANTEKLVTSKKESTLTVKEPAKTDKQDSKITSEMANKFSKNGSSTGKDSEKSGAGGEGSGVKGSVKGRNFLGCNLPSVQLKTKYVVVVSIEVDENGKVVSASVSKTGGAPQDICNKCVSAARTARWSEKAGAATVRGSLTFTLVPKI